MNAPLTGCRILVVEDDYFLAAEYEHILTEAGAEIVGPCADVPSAMCHLRSERFELALVDVKLHEELSYPFADILLLLNTPFLFATAFTGEDLPQRFRQHDRLEKPFGARALLEAVSHLRRRSDGGPRRSGERTAEPLPGNPPRHD